MPSSNFQLENFIRTLDAWGLSDVLLPFILVFAITFAILQKMKVLGNESKNVNIVVALVIGLLFVVPHVTGHYGSMGMDPVEIINQAIPGVSVVAIAALMVLLLIGLSGWQPKDGNKTPTAIFVLAILFVVYFFGAAAGWWAGWGSLTNFFGEDAVALVIILLVFGIIIWFITGSGEKKKTGAGIFGDIGKWLGGK